MEDIVKQKGYLTLGSRFRRIGERLQADVQVMTERQGLDIPAALFPTLGVIDRHSMLTVGEIASALGISQPGATRNINQLVSLGLVDVTPSEDDKRMRHVTLTRKCKTQLAKAKAELWPRVEQAVADICQPLQGGLLDILAAIEAALDEKPLAQRARLAEKVK